MVSLRVVYDCLEETVKDSLKIIVVAVISAVVSAVIAIEWAGGGQLSFMAADGTPVSGAPKLAEKKGFQYWRIGMYVEEAKRPECKMTEEALSCFTELEGTPITVEPTWIKESLASSEKQVVNSIWGYAGDCWNDEKTARCIVNPLQRGVLDGHYKFLRAVFMEAYGPPASCEALEDWTLRWKQALEKAGCADELVWFGRPEMGPSDADLRQQCETQRETALRADPIPRTVRLSWIDGNTMLSLFHEDDSLGFGDQTSFLITDIPSKLEAIRSKGKCALDPVRVKRATENL